MRYHSRPILAQITKRDKRWGHPRPTQPRTSRGFALVMLIFMLLLVIGFTAAMTATTMQNYTNTNRLNNKLKARYAIRAGIATALHKLSEQSSWNPSKSTPHKEFLDEQKEIGFKLWFEGINRDSEAAIEDGDGTRLEKGQASLKVCALINDQEFTSGLAGLEQKFFLVQPQVKFDDNIFDDRKANWNTGGMSVNFQLVDFYSYNSNVDAPIRPYTGSGKPPIENQHAALRALGDVDLQNRMSVWGTVTTPTGSRVRSQGGGTIPNYYRGQGFYYFKEQEFNDDVHVPWRFTTPEWVKEQAGGAWISLAPGETRLLTQGVYSRISVGSNATLELERGGTYWFKSGPTTLHPGARIRLMGTSDKPTTIYARSLWTVDSTPGKVTSINMPETTGALPKPNDLQIYLLSDVGNDNGSRIGHFLEGAFVLALGGRKIELRNDIKIYGAIHGSVTTLGKFVELHYDQALIEQEGEAKAEWVVVNQTLN